MTDLRHPKLASNRSARWAFMDRFEVPQYEGDGVYLTRWRIVQTPWGGLYLHRMEGPDPRATLHDHPWSFLSLILRGGYVERRLDPMTMRVDEGHRVRWWNRMRATDAHSIRSLLRVPTWTLLLVGKRRRTWGYLEGPAWQHWEVQGNTGRWWWTEFNRHQHNDEFVAALARRKTRTERAS